MKVVGVRVGVAVSAAACGLLAGSAAWAGPPKETASGAKDSAPSSVLITNGLLRTVHYFPSKDMSAPDLAALRDQERVENELALNNQLTALRQQYVANERVLESKRFVAQEQLLNSINAYAPGIYPDEVRAVDYYGALAAGASYLGGYYSPFGTSGFAPYQYALPAALDYTAPAALTPAAGTALTLGFEEGRLKTELVRGLADQAKPEYAASLRRNLNDMLARGPSRGTGPKPAAGTVPEPGKESKAAPANVTVALRNGTMLTGTKTNQDADWLYLDTPNGKMQIRLSEVQSILTP
jgi:hypothetical protein